MELKTYINDLASNKPVPGGGSVSAFSGAQGVSLILMVCELTLGRKKYADFEVLVQEVVEKGIVLQKDLMHLVDEDSNSYALVMDAFALPKETDEEKDIRKKVIHEGLIGAAAVPFKTMEKSFKAMQLAESLVGKSNANAASDLGVAAIQLETAIKGAWLNVLINVSGMEDERAIDMIEKGEKIIADSGILSTKIYESIKNSL